MAKAKDPKKAAQNIARLRSMGAKIAVVAVMLSGWLFFIMLKAPVVPQEGQATAQKAGEQGGEAKAPESTGSYVMSYSMVLMCVGLGLLLVTRASNRRDRARPEQYEEGSGLVEELPPEPEKKKK